MRLAYASDGLVDVGDFGPGPKMSLDQAGTTAVPPSEDGLLFQQMATWRECVKLHLCHISERRARGAGVENEGDSMSWLQGAVPIEFHCNRAAPLRVTSCCLPKTRFNRHLELAVRQLVEAG